MSELKLRQLPVEIWCEAGKTPLAELIKTKHLYGMLTAFLIVEYGKEQPGKDCVVEIVEGPDKGKRFVANVTEPQRFLEAASIYLKALANPEE